MTDSYPPSDQEHLVAQDKLNMMAAVGYALTKWGAVEDSMATLFAATIGGDRTDVSTTVFFSVASIDARLKMVNAGMTARHVANKAVLSRWANIKNRIGRRKDRRNELAHGQVISYFNEQKYKETYLVPYYANTKVRAKYTAALLKEEQLLDLIKMEKKYSLSDVQCFGNAFDSLKLQINLLYTEIFLIPNVSPKPPSELS